jgi:hypothetical protein
LFTCYFSVTADLTFYSPIITHFTLLLPCYFSVTADLTFYSPIITNFTLLLPCYFSVTADLTFYSPIILDELGDILTNPELPDNLNGAQSRLEEHNHLKRRVNMAPVEQLGMEGQRILLSQTLPCCCHAISQLLQI